MRSSPTTIRSSSLFRQIATRLLLAGAVSGALAVGLGTWFQHVTNERVTQIRMNRVLEHFRNELADLEFRWGREAFNLKSRLEFSRILETDGARDARFRSFLVAQGGYLDFPLVAVDDRHGNRLFEYSAGSDRAPRVRFPEGAEAIWYFDAEREVLYRVFRQPVWVGEGNGALVLFRPIDNALLLRASDPEASITVLWNQRPVASSAGSDALRDAEQALTKPGDTAVALLPWSAGEMGSQPSALLQLTAIQGLGTREMMTPLMIGGLMFILIAWSMLGRWMLATLKRLAALERGQQAFVEGRGVDDAVLSELQQAGGATNDEISRLAGAVRDMMQGVEANERNLRESEFFFRESQRVAEVGSYTCDFQAGTFKASPVLDGIFGIDATHPHTVDTWLRLLHPEDAPEMARYLREEVIGAGHPFAREYRIVRVADGQTRWVSGRGELGFDASGKVVSMIGTIHDITERKRVEERLALAGMVFDSAAEGIMVTDGGNCIIMVNPAFTTITGFSAEEALGRDPRMLSSGRQDIAFYRALWTELLGRGRWKGELWNRRRDGTPYLQRTSIAMIRDAEGKPFRHVSMIYDVTEQWVKEQEIHDLNATLERRVAERTLSLHESNLQLKEALETLGRTQKDLVRAEKLAALGAVVAGVAHEMNTPIGNSLTVASTLSERTHEIRRQFEDGSMKRSELEGFLDASERAANMLVASMNRAHELVANFKQVAVDQTSENRRQFDLAVIVEENLLVLRPGFKRLPFVIEVKVPDGLVMDSFPGPLGQVLSNIIGNAMQHAFEGRDHGTVRVSATDDGPSVRLVIADDGVGMDEAVRARAFDPFFTTKFGKGGSGLGLHISFNIVTGVLGGSIDLESEPGVGSRFLIAIPKTAPVRVDTP